VIKIAREFFTRSAATSHHAKPLSSLVAVDDDRDSSSIFETTISTKIYQRLVSSQRNTSKAFPMQRKRRHAYRDFSRIFKKAGTYITELNYAQLSEVGQTVMCGILVHNEGDILHGLGTEPASHLSLVFLVGIQEQRGDALNKIGCWLL
jgi:hypothetical protein